MVDPDEIQVRYRAMSDEQLLHFAKEEGTELTETAFLILKSEFIRRKIEPEIVARIEDGSLQAEKKRLKNISKIIPDNAEATALAIALNEKRDGKTDDDIVYHLLDIGLDEEKALIIIRQMKTEANLLQSRARNGMLTSAFTFCAGVALYLINPSKPMVTFLDILVTCTIAFGVLRFLVKFMDFKKYKTILTVIDQEYLAPANPKDPTGSN